MGGGVHLNMGVLISWISRCRALSLIPPKASAILSSRGEVGQGYFYLPEYTGGNRLMYPSVYLYTLSRHSTMNSTCNFDKQQSVVDDLFALETTNINDELTIHQ